MKRILIGILMLIALSAAQANPVSPSTTLQVAVNFWNTYRPASVKPVAPSDLTMVAGAAFPMMHMYQAAEGDGFIIVAADDCVQPVLAYSFDSRLVKEEVNPELRFWLSGFNAQIAEAAQMGLKAEDNALRQWRQLLTSPVPAEPLTLTSIPAMCQTRWDQDAPFNQLCPYDSVAGARTVVGCVATAMAQVMKYWNHPSTGTGYHEYEYNGYRAGTSTYGIGADFGHTTYIWEYMPSLLTLGSPTNYINAVSLLSFHCGVAVDMMYGTSGAGGSGAYSSCGFWASACAEHAFYEFFKYDSSTIVFRDRAGYSDSDWIAMVDTNLLQGQPMYYNGSDSTGGHAFVLDGADTQSRYHFNWGWGGYGDGFYALNDLAPRSGGSGGNATYTFNRHQGAIFGIRPLEETFDTVDYYDTICSGTRYYVFHDYRFRIYNDSSFTAKYLDTVFHLHVSIVDKHNAYFNPNGGEGRVMAIQYCPAEGVVMPDCDFTYENHVFRGWSKSQNERSRIYRPGDVVKIYSAQTFYAMWRDTTQTSHLDIDPADANGMVVWPNPTDGKLHISTGCDDRVEVTLYDVMGRVVMRKEMPGQGGEIDLRSLPAGTYNVHVDSPSAAYNRRIIKQ